MKIRTQINWLSVIVGESIVFIAVLLSSLLKRLVAEPAPGSSGMWSAMVYMYDWSLIAFIGVSGFLGIFIWYMSIFRPLTVDELFGPSRPNSY